MQQNPLNRFFNNENNNIPQNQGGNNPMQMINEFMKFAKGFQGNPQQEVMNMLNNGQMTQEQFNQLSQQAKQLQNMFSQLGIK